MPVEYFHPQEPFTIQGRDGLPRTFTPDQVIADDDPDYKGREQLFEPVSKSVERASQSRSSGGPMAARAAETASAAPGEKRFRTQPSAAATAAAAAAAAATTSPPK
jgi:hypothetical protein